jgi:hypothetical protein
MVLIILKGFEGWAQSKSASKAPMITHFFAVDKGYYGYIWRIYIEAEDADGDMLKIASVVDEVGYGRYPTDFIIVKPKHRKHLKGYIQWNTFSSRTSYLPEWTQLTLKVSIIDRDGNESNEIVLPFTFESRKGSDPYTPPLLFDEGLSPRLGHIAIDLFPIGGDYGGAGPHR